MIQQSSHPSPAITERARRVDFRSQSANDETHGWVEVLSGKGGVMEINISQSHKKRHDGKRWTTRNVTVTISMDDWKHLISAT